MEVRIARHTERLDELVEWYRDRLGLPERGRFSGHDGYDGVFLDLPGTGAHLEFTSGGEGEAPVPHPESLLVIYCADAGERGALAARLPPEAAVEPANPPTGGPTVSPSPIPTASRSRWRCASPPPPDPLARTVR